MLHQFTIKYFLQSIVFFSVFRCTDTQTDCHTHRETK